MGNSIDGTGATNCGLVAKGLTNTEIGIELWITQNSVKQALKRMFQLNVCTRRVGRPTSTDGEL